MIPCKECLKYALCKHKRHIDCKDLAIWYNGNRNVGKYLPNLISINMTMSHDEHKTLYEDPPFIEGGINNGTIL